MADQQPGGRRQDHVALAVVGDASHLPELLHRITLHAVLRTDEAEGAIPGGYCYVGTSSIGRNPHAPLRVFVEAVHLVVAQRRSLRTVPVVSHAPVRGPDVYAVTLRSYPQPAAAVLEKRIDTVRQPHGRRLQPTACRQPSRDAPFSAYNRHLTGKHAYPRASLPVDTHRTRLLVGHHLRLHKAMLHEVNQRQRPHAGEPEVVLAVGHELGYRRQVGRRRSRLLLPEAHTVGRCQDVGHQAPCLLVVVGKGAASGYQPHRAELVLMEHGHLARRCQQRADHGHLHLPLRPVSGVDKGDSLCVGEHPQPLLAVGEDGLHLVRHASQRACHAAALRPLQGDDHDAGVCGSHGTAVVEPHQRVDAAHALRHARHPVAAPALLPQPYLAAGCCQHHRLAQLHHVVVGLRRVEAAPHDGGAAVGEHPFPAVVVEQHLVNGLMLKRLVLRQVGGDAPALPHQTVVDAEVGNTVTAHHPRVAVAEGVDSTHVDLLATELRQLFAHVPVAAVARVEEVQVVVVGDAPQVVPRRGAQAVHAYRAQLCTLVVSVDARAAAEGHEVVAVEAAQPVPCCQPYQVVVRLGEARNGVRRQSVADGERADAARRLRRHAHRTQKQYHK